MCIRDRSITSDLPVIKKNTVVTSTRHQIIDGKGKYRLFATIRADLTINNCTLSNGAAIGGNAKGGGGGGLGAGGGIYIDRGNTLTLSNTKIIHCKAEGGSVTWGYSPTNGGGASFSSENKNGQHSCGGGDYPGVQGDKGGTGGAYDGSTFLKGYGGGSGGNNGGKGGGNGPGVDQGGTGLGGYCGGGGGKARECGCSGGNGGGNGKKNNLGYPTFSGGGGGGGFGSGGAASSPVNQAGAGGGGFGGGGGQGYSGLKQGGGGGGFGGGGGGADIPEYSGKGGRYAGDGSTTKNQAGGGGAGLGGAIFIGDGAKIELNMDGYVILENNQGIGGEAKNPGQGYAPDIFLFRESEVYFNNEQSAIAPFTLQSDLQAPPGHLDKGVIKRGSGILYLSNTNNNYRGGTFLKEGTLSIANPKVVGCATSPIVLEGGTLQVTQTLIIPNPIVVKAMSRLDVLDNVVFNTTNSISEMGVVSKIGNGIWNYYGNSANTTVAIHVEQGIFRACKKLSAKNIKVHKNAVFEGSCITSNNFTNDGLVKPCMNHLGSLFIRGNYKQTVHGALRMEVRPNGTHDILEIEGTGCIEGALHLNFTPGRYTLSDSYTLIRAKGLTGFFTQITSNKPGCAVVDFEKNEVKFIILTPKSIFPIKSNTLRTDKKYGDMTFLAALTPKVYKTISLQENQTIYYVTNFRR